MMGIRGRVELRRVQAGVLEAYRAARGANVAVTVAEDQPVAATLGKVNAVVASDPELGAHLVVAAQHFSGKPPVATAAARVAQVAYPTPNRVVGDYAVGEFVELVTVRGALMAVKMG